MSAALQLGIARIRRRPGQTATQALVLALAVALLGAMILFIGHSLRTMTASATRSVPLDLQGPVGDYGRARTLAAGIAKQPDVAQASPVATAPFAGVVHSGAAGVTAAGAGAVLAVPPGYLHRIGTFRFLRGGLRPGEIVLDQQLAATLRARLGDTVKLRLGSHRAPQDYRVGGVALVTAPDVLFQPLDPVAGPAPAQPPANIAIMPVGTFAATIGDRLPSLGPANPGSAAVPGTPAGVQWQVQAQLDRASLGGTPSEALRRAGQIRNSLERSFPGKIRVRRQPLGRARNSGRRRALRGGALHHARRPRRTAGARASPIWRRSGRSSATGANSPCSAPAAPAAASCWSWRRANRASSAWSPGCSARGSRSPR